MKIIQLCICLLFVLPSLSQQKPFFLQSPEIYKKAGVKKLMWQYALVSKTVYGYVLDSSGHTIQQFTLTEENGPLASSSYYSYDSAKRISQIISLIFKDNDKPGVLRTLPPDTIFTYNYYDESGKLTKDISYSKGIITSISLFNHDPEKVHSVSYLKNGDSVLNDITFQEGHLVQSHHTRYFTKTVKYHLIERIYSYAYKSGRIKKQMSDIRMYVPYIKNPSKRYDVHFYSYFKNGLLKKITSKNIFGVGFKYEYF